MAPPTASTQLSSLASGHLAPVVQPSSLNIRGMNHDAITSKLIDALRQAADTGYKIDNVEINKGNVFHTQAVGPDILPLIRITKDGGGSIDIKRSWLEDKRKRTGLLTHLIKFWLGGDISRSIDLIQLVAQDVQEVTDISWDLYEEAGKPISEVIADAVECQLGANEITNPLEMCSYLLDIEARVLTKKFHEEQRANGAILAEAEPKIETAEPNEANTMERINSQVTCGEDLYQFATFDPSDGGIGVFADRNFRENAYGFLHRDSMAATIEPPWMSKATAQFVARLLVALYYRCPENRVDILDQLIEKVGIEFHRHDLNALQNQLNNLTEGQIPYYGEDTNNFPEVFPAARLV